MSALKGEVGKRKVEWKKLSGGPVGTGVVEVDGKSYTVSWKKDADGFWIEFPNGVKGYDLFAEKDDVEGLLFRVQERNQPEHWSGLRFKRAGEAAASAGASGQKRAARVRAQMPGKIVRVLVKAGDEVAKDQPLLVMEAMKMENEIRASQAGKVEAVKVSDGQAVETGADLVLIG